MKILVVGGTGTIGQAVVKELSARHEVIVAGNKSGDVQVDITDPNSIANMYQDVRAIDAVISTTGSVHFGEFEAMTAEQYQIGINSKLMGQVNLVLLGKDFVNEKGSFTLTSGILAREPIRFGSSATMVNAALEGFTIAAAIEMPKQLRINIVSPTLLSESVAKIGGFFRGFKPVPAAQVALAYSKSVEGLQTGQIYRVD